MNATTTLFDRYKESLEVRSDRQAAMRLGVKVQTVSNWRTRGSQAEAATIDAMCKQLDEDAMPWLLRIQAEQGGEDSRNGQVWQRVAMRLGVSLPALAIVLDGLAELTLGNLMAPMAGSSSGAAAFVVPLLRTLAAPTIG